MLGVVRPIQMYCESLLHDVYAAKHSITASAILLQSTALLRTGRCHINFSPVKICPHAAASGQNSLTTCYVNCSENILTSFRDY